MGKLQGRDKLLNAVHNDSTSTAQANSNPQSGIEPNPSDGFIPDTSPESPTQNHAPSHDPLEGLDYEPVEPLEIVNDFEPEETPSEKPVHNQGRGSQVTDNDRGISENLKKILAYVEEFNANELLNKEFPPLKWAVDGFLPSGLSILAGGPKVGKSIMSLHLSLAVAIGGCALGKINVEKGDVLYLALEDSSRRLQERILQSGIPEDSDLSRLTLTTRVPRQHEGGIEYIRWWLENHKGARLVIIDTLQKFRKQLTAKGNIYAEDYDAVSAIKELADEFDVPILVIHHLKKAMSDDWLNEISGSQGIAGAADTLFSLKRTRTENKGILHRTGRDVEEKDFDMELDGFIWILKGDKGLFTMPEWQRDIVEYLLEHEHVTAMELSEAKKIPLSTAQSNINRFHKAGGLEKTGYGKYVLTQKYSDN